MLAYTQDQVFERVRDCFCEALGLEEDEVELGSGVIDDLGAESLDLLDIVFRLERSFGVKIPRGNLEEEARASLDGEAYEVDGVLTDIALVKLREAMPEVDGHNFVPGLRVNDVPRLFTVETFQNIVIQLIQDKALEAA